MKTALLVTLLFALSACGPEVSVYMGPATLVNDAPASRASRNDSQVIYVFPSDDNSTLLISGMVTELVVKRTLADRIEVSPTTSSRTLGQDYSETVKVLDGEGAFSASHADLTIHVERTTISGTSRSTEKITATFSGSKI